MKLNLLAIASFLILIYSIQCAYKIHDKDEFYTNLKNDKKGTEYYYSVIEHLKQILNYYVYIDLFKNPPQPSFDENYHPKVDTLSTLDQIKSNITNETYYYDFYRRIKLLIDNYRDAHMSYGLRGFPFSYAFLCPIKLTTKKYENGTKYMTGEIAFNNQSYFKNGAEVFSIIKRNIGIPILKINGKNPFVFMQTFGGDFFNLKNSQANYAFKTHQYKAPFIGYFPFNEDEILFNVEYEGGDKFETEYAIAETVSSNENSDEGNLNYFFDDKNVDQEFMQYLSNYFTNNDYGTPKSLDEILNEFSKSKKVKNNLSHYESKNEFDYENILSEKDSEFSKIEWDYEYNPGDTRTFKCRIDEENHLDVIHMPTFDFRNLTKILDLLKSCIQLFDTNKYKIVVILDFNGGGIERVSQTLIEYIQPHIASRFYSTFRHGEYLDRYNETNFEDHSIVETCKVPNKSYILEKIRSIDYGEGVINNVTEPLRRFGQNRKEYNEFKKSLKNKRKPHEILIFTDGYSASAASLFTKSLQNEGGAIVVGYNGNPVSDAIFDGSQHFSTVFNLDDLDSLEPDLMAKMKNESIYFTQICRTNNLFDYRDISVPEEFNIMEVDEVSDIYEAYNEDENYNLFMAKANETFEKYETKCNYKNKRMTLFDDKCTFPEDKFAHGGHPCKENKEWDMENCQKVYCDEGYLMDYKENKCVRDPCIPVDDGGKDGIGSYIKMNLFVIGLISLILIF